MIPKNKNGCLKSNEKQFIKDAEPYRFYYIFVMYTINVGDSLPDVPKNVNDHQIITVGESPTVMAILHTTNVNEILYLLNPDRACPGKSAV